MSVATKVVAMADKVQDFWLTNARLRNGHPPAGGATNGTVGKILLGSAMAVGLGGVGYAAHALLSKPETQQQTTVIEKGGDASLFDYLEEGGYHLPEGFE